MTKTTRPGKKGSGRRLGPVSILSAVATVIAFAVRIPFYLVYRLAKLLAEPGSDGLRVGLALALALHVLLLLLGGRLVPSKDDKGRIEMEILKPDEMLEKYEPREKPPDGEVVRAKPSPDTRPPPIKPRFLAEKDSRTDKETTVRVRTPAGGQAASAAEPKAAQDRNTPAEQAGVGPLPPEIERARQEGRQAERRTPLSLEDVDLKPSAQALADAIAGSGLDRVEDLLDGEATVLNAASWQYSAFLNRVKRQVEQRWHPDEEFRSRDPYGNVYGLKDRVTVLLVVLTGDGAVSNLYVMEPSGAPFLDEVAYRAVESAAPFPHVPEGMKDKKTGLVMFTFQFTVEVGGSPVFRVRRYDGPER
ncbi:MAG: cell envelope integrity protein TolA [Deltaproteobacteria bacterium]|nr:cell envelope integrity protein TolA [Deltaproteobacteria bacterium]